jgi:SAM-dependent methyltransferase
MPEDYRNSWWWDERVVARQNNLKDLIFNDDYREQFWENTDEVLSHYSKYSVADIGCGYGRFAKHFDKYTGYDFSGEMIKLANKNNPDKAFYKRKAFEPLNEKVDIVFEVNCLHSFGQGRQEFFEYYSQFARKAVICIERNEVNIFWIYEKKDKDR